MKFNSTVRTALVSLGLLTAAFADEAVKFNVPGVSAQGSTPATPAKAPAAPAVAPAPTAAPAAAATKFTEAQLLEAFGYSTMLQAGIADQIEAWEFTPAQREAMIRGITLALTNKSLPYDRTQAQQLGEQIKEFLGGKQQAFIAKRDAFLDKVRLQNLADNVAFFTKLKENKGITVLPSGLCYEILKPGTGAVAKPGQMATIHYTLSLIDGKPLESSVESGQPVDLVLVAPTPTTRGTIAGMIEGLQKVAVGGRAKLYIPPSLAYGDQPNGNIPPGAALIFEIEVMGVKDAPKEPAAAK